MAYSTTNSSPRSVARHHHAPEGDGEPLNPEPAPEQHQEDEGQGEEHRQKKRRPVNIS